MSCPFYGKRIVPGEFQESEMKNQCALNFRGISPCELEMRGKVVEWERCYYADQRMRALIEQKAELAGLRFKKTRTLKIASSV